MNENKLSQVLDETFEQEVIQSEIPVLVDFWAEWCGPCKMMTPVLEEVAGDYQGRLKIVKLDVDENQATANQYNIRSIPTLILFKDGTRQGDKVGASSKAQLVSFIDQLI